MEEQSNEALWYVVHTYSGYENKVANDLQTMVENRHLQDLICDIKVPVEMVPEIDKNGKQKMVEHKLFPGYVLVKMVMNDDTWYVVRNTRGCTGFVGPASKPVPLSAEEVEKMGVEKAAPSVPGSAPRYTRWRGLWPSPSPATFRPTRCRWPWTPPTPAR